MLLAHPQFWVEKKHQKKCFKIFKTIGEPVFHFLSGAGYFKEERFNYIQSQP